MNEYQNVVDRSGWGLGPWSAEECDKRIWVDPRTGLGCMIRRNPHMGNWCGYVGVPPGHPWHGVDHMQCAQSPPCGEDFCDHSPDAVVRVHGGLTFSERCDDEAIYKDGWVHIVDMATAEPGRPKDVWWFGWDAAHAEDFVPGMEPHLRDEYLNGRIYRDMAYAIAETELLALQLAAVR